MLKYTISAQRQFEAVETGEVWFDCMWLCSDLIF